MEGEDRISSEFMKLYKIRKTVFQMLKDRVGDAEVNQTYEEFRAQYQTREMIVVYADNREGDSMMVMFPSEEKLGISELENHYKKFVEYSVPRGILVIKNDLTSHAKKVLENQEEFQIEIFQDNELLINITQHEMVPKHVLINEKEKKELLLKQQFDLNSRVRETQLPKILHTDPVAKYLGLRKGNVVKIIRNSETAGKYVTYRLVL